MTVMCKGQAFTVTRGGDGVFVVTLGPKVAGFFSLDEGEVCVRGWYTNVTDSGETIHDVGVEVAATRAA